MTRPDDAGWDDDPGPDDRPNLLAAVSVLFGAAGLASLSFFFLGIIFVVPTACGLLGGLTALGAARQAQSTGFGASYARWGLALSAFNLLVGAALGTLVLSWL